MSRSPIRLGRAAVGWIASRTPPAPRGNRPAPPSRRARATRHTPAGARAALAHAPGRPPNPRAPLVRRHGAERGQVLAEGSHRAEDEHVAPGALAQVARELGAAPVDLAPPPGQAAGGGGCP